MLNPDGGFSQPAGNFNVRLHTGFDMAIREVALPEVFKYAAVYMSVKSNFSFLTQHYNLPVLTYLLHLDKPYLNGSDELG